MAGHRHALGNEVCGEGVQRAIECRGHGPAECGGVLWLRREQLFGNPTVREGFGSMRGLVRHDLALEQHRGRWQHAGIDVYPGNHMHEHDGWVAAVQEVALGA
jgi:hypothetical protein